MLNDDDGDDDDGTELGQHPYPSSSSLASPHLATFGSASEDGKHWRITCFFSLEVGKSVI